MLRNLIGYKHTIYDVYPLRDKKVFLLVDPQNILGDTSDFHATFSTIAFLLQKQASVIVASSFGPLVGITLNLTKRELKVALDAFKNENGMGYTNYFAGLSPDLKLNIIHGILDPESIAAATSDGTNQLQTGKTQLFAGLPMNKKIKAKEMFFPTKEFAPSSTMPFVSALKTRFPDVNVGFAPDCMRLPQQNPRTGEILVLENLRFYMNETSPSGAERGATAEALASNLDLYVNDSFATAHAPLASTTELPRLLRHGAAGLSMHRELSFYAKFLNHLAYPLAVVVAGTDVPEKLQLIYRLIGRVDRILVGGAVALPFLASKGLGCGLDSPLDDKPTTGGLPCSRLAGRILEACAARHVELVLPIDHFVGSDPAAAAKGRAVLVESAAVPPGAHVLDCGMGTVHLFTRSLRGCRTVLWTGTLGRTAEGYRTGTAAFATELRKLEISAIVAGEETSRVVREIGVADKMMHLSSGGVASLSVVEGNLLPGVAALSDIGATASDLKGPSNAIAPVNAMLCKLPPFVGCDSHNLQLIAKRFVRRTHESGDYLVFKGDRHMCMYLVAQGGLLAQLDDEDSSAPARYIGKGQTVGMYEFFTQALAFEMVRVAQPETVTYQLSSPTLNELLNSHHDLAVMLLKNISEPLYEIVTNDYRKQQSVGVILRRNACRTRVPQLLSVPERPSLKWDVLQDVLSTLCLHRLSLKYGPFAETAPHNSLCDPDLTLSDPFARAIKVIQRHGLPFVLASTILRDFIYHQFVGLLKHPWMAASLAAILTSPLRVFSYGFTYNEINFKMILNEALISGAVAVTPLAAYTLALELRRRTERYRKKRLNYPAQLAIMALVKLLLGFVVFPIVYHRNFIPTQPSASCSWDNTSFLAYQRKQVISLLLRRHAITFRSSYL